MTANKRYTKGFTLIEMLLVLVIISGIVYMGAGYLQQRALSLRIDRTSGQMQQILNAGLSYYISNNKWPVSAGSKPSALDGTNVLQTGGYLPSSMPSPWGGANYYIYSTASNFYVSVAMPTTNATSINIAKTIMGTLPLSFTDQSASATSVTTPCAVGKNCYVITTVNIPGESLNGAQAINFAGLYHSGACVPAPQCPTNYTAQAFVVPVAVNGFYSAPTVTGGNCTPTDKSGCQMTYYPLNGYTAYTTQTSAVSASTGPYGCGTGNSTPSPCYEDGSTGTPGTQFPNSPPYNSTNYWRVCIAVTTSSGDVAPSGTYENPWGQLTGTVLVMTRCQPPSENVGSNFYVWEPSNPPGT